MEAPEVVEKAEEAEEVSGDGSWWSQKTKDLSLSTPATPECQEFGSETQQGLGNFCPNSVLLTLKPERDEEEVISIQSPLIEGNLEPQNEDLINRINELQQAKKKSSEELGEAQALWETLHKELDSLNGEKVHLEEVLSKKQEALRILQLHCQRKESGAQKLHVEEQLENLMGQHKDLWEFHMLKQRLAREICALQSSKEQLLTEEKLARAKLEEVERQLSSGRAPAVNDGLKAELEKFGGRVLP
ncbi:synaptonemal complex central element protein 1-like [Leptonychotes weddellii]|uniref:Synaptonemal complex central element protein 1-like n=1 Tax=Leptonychotes weddellii TaxID=9713 RepID=A0A2U3YUE9_LEPWE|nr:synaptonemal complex central element protein 1-like [Leptonychotes weddellii]